MKNEILSIIQSNNLVLINFKSSTCDSCQMIDPTLQEVKKAIGERVEIHTLEINNLPLTFNELQIDSLPLLALFVEGKLIWEAKEVLSKDEIIKKIVEIES
ncbi:thioredoxin family protein [Flavobacterium azooxidireducens]|uniref:Thioredoxin family protein n=1 Tax=Flavobacterium azooxidireducens TaxID=1871076 RepID=A0ABY4KF03_9FLAO|nr:thioredoxin family protein [Flavobacterium azooxidireducens]UPQ78343.1 thioredoxin family protein [Flavobacterium azooxidireducens]